MDKLIFGCGYLGSRVAQCWRDAGDRVFVVTRSANRARKLREEGFSPIVGDVTRPATLIELPVAQTVLYAIGHDRTSGASIHEVFVSGLQAALNALPTETSRFIYISSTGVYGQTEGELVDEESPCRPVRDAGIACLAAEKLLARHPLGAKAIILRLAGLYGPGRIPRKSNLVAGLPIAAPADGYLNLIHVDDAVRVVLSAEKSSRVPRTYVVSDGHPVLRSEYFAELARLLHAPPPRYSPPPPDSAAAQRAVADKRVSNKRMLAELNVKLAYPTYREVLTAIMAAEAHA